jgi:hypothetical protein
MKERHVETVEKMVAMLEYARAAILEVVMDLQMVTMRVSKLDDQMAVLKVLQSEVLLAAEMAERRAALMVKE